MRALSHIFYALEKVVGVVDEIAKLLKLRKNGCDLIKRLLITQGIVIYLLLHLFCAFFLKFVAVTFFTKCHTEDEPMHECMRIRVWQFQLGNR